MLLKNVNLSSSKHLLTCLNWLEFKRTIHVCKAMHILKHFKGQGQIFLSRSYKPNWRANLSQTHGKGTAEFSNVIKSFLICTSDVGSECTIVRRTKNCNINILHHWSAVTSWRERGNDFISNPVLFYFFNNWNIFWLTDLQCSIKTHGNISIVRVTADYQLKILQKCFSSSGNRLSNNGLLK